MSTLPRILLTGIVTLSLSATCVAQIFRWDNGELIAGTESVAAVRRAMLQDLNLEYANLRGHDLHSANLERSNLSHAEMSGANLFLAKLTHANFSNANLTDVDLTQTTLKDAVFRDAWIGGANLTDVLHFSMEQLSSTANYRAKDLRGLTFNGEIEEADLVGGLLAAADLQGVSVFASNLSGADLVTATLRDAYLEDVDLSNANLALADLRNVAVEDVDFTGAVVLGANLTFENGFTKEHLYSTASYQNQHLRRIALSLHNVEGLDLRGQDLTGAELSRATRAAADLTDAIVNGVIFSGGRLAEAQLYSTASYRSKDLRGIRFSLDMSSRDGWDFRSQDLTGSSFTAVANADFTGATINGTFFGEPLTKEQLYSTASYQAKDLRAFRFRGRHSDWDLRGQDLTDATFENLVGADISDAVIRGALFKSPPTKEQFYSTASFQIAKDLRGIELNGDLTGWDFSGLNLAGARLAGTTLTGAEFTATDLRGAILRGATGFSPSESTLTRNMVWPDGSIKRLEVVGNELLELDYRRPALAPGVHEKEFGDSDIVIPITDVLSVDELATMRIEFGYDPSEYVLMAPRFDASTADVRLGGTLQLSNDGLDVYGSLDLFDWPAPLEQDNQFHSVIVPAGTLWDLSNLYSTGEITFVEMGEAGDLLVDGQFTATDIDMLSRHVNALGGRYDLTRYELKVIDLNGDLLVNEDDRQFWVEELVGTLAGDANLDRRVDFSDFITLADGFHQRGGWGDGDFDGDGHVRFQDFVLLSANFGSTPPAPVPEPSPSLGMVLVLLRWLGGRPRRRIVHGTGKAS